MHVNPITLIGSYPSRHWRGEHGLMTTFLVSGLGLRVALAGIQPALLGFPAWVVVGFCLAANLVVLVWQVVGALRAGRAHLHRTGDVIAAWAGYGTVLVVIVIAAVQTANVAAALAAKPVISVSAPDPRVRLGPGRTEIVVDGPLDYGLNSALAAVLVEHPEVRTVVLASDGGLIFAARAIALRIRERDLATRVDRTCSSACTIAFMAGGSRTLGPQGRLGFHRYRIASSFGLQIVDPDAELARDRAFFLRQGVSAGFLERAFAVNYTDIWFPSRSELLAAGVITRE